MDKKIKKSFPLVPSVKYEGLYVATRSFRDNRVLAFGKNPSKVLQSARDQGIKNPLFFKVPKNIPYILVSWKNKK